MPPILSAQATIRAKTTTDLIAWAEADGAVILWSPDLPERGRYIRTLDAIVLRHGMTERRTLSTLAHELGHRVHGDTCSDERAERRAWTHAAHLLIDPREYAAAELEHEAVGAMAQALGVTVEVVHAWQRIAGRSRMCDHMCDHE